MKMTIKMLMRGRIDLKNGNMLCTIMNVKVIKNNQD